MKKNLLPSLLQNAIFAIATPVRKKVTCYFWSGWVGGSTVPVWSSSGFVLGVVPSRRTWADLILRVLLQVLNFFFSFFLLLAVLAVAGFSLTFVLSCREAFRQSPAQKAIRDAKGRGKKQNKNTTAGSKKRVSPLETAESDLTHCSALFFSPKSS